MPHKGYKQTPEHKAKLAQARTGWRKSKAKGWIHQGRRVVQDGPREVLEHRYIMEKYLGRQLTCQEVVHHINGNPLDNRLENLQLMTKGQHSSLHDIGKDRTGKAKWHWTPEQRVKYMAAIARRPPISAETRRKIGEASKCIRAIKFWNNKTKH
jgi:hypothetical protein